MTYKAIIVYLNFAAPMYVVPECISAIQREHYSTCLFEG